MNHPVQSPYSWSTVEKKVITLADMWKEANDNQISLNGTNQAIEHGISTGVYTLCALTCWWTALLLNAPDAQQYIREIVEIKTQGVLNSDSIFWGFFLSWVGFSWSAIYYWNKYFK